MLNHYERVLTKVSKLNINKLNIIFKNMEEILVQRFGSPTFSNTMIISALLRIQCFFFEKITIY